MFGAWDLRFAAWVSGLGDVAREIVGLWARSLGWKLVSCRLQFGDQKEDDGRPDQDQESLDVIGFRVWDWVHR